MAVHFCRDATPSKPPPDDGDDFTAAVLVPTLAFPSLASFICCQHFSWASTATCWLVIVGNLQLEVVSAFALISTVAIYRVWRSATLFMNRNACLGSEADLSGGTQRHHHRLHVVQVTLSIRRCLLLCTTPRRPSKERTNCWLGAHKNRHNFSLLQHTICVWSAFWKSWYMSVRRSFIVPLLTGPQSTCLAYPAL